MRSVLSVHWKDWCWRWNSNTLATWCKELTHLKRPWCWERLRVGEGDGKGWDGWMASPTRWTWVWVNSGSWWWTGRPGVLWFMGLQRVGHDWVTELHWTDTCKLEILYNGVCYSASLLNYTFNEVTLVAWSQSWWEYTIEINKYYQLWFIVSLVVGLKIAEKILIMEIKFKSVLCL